MKIVGITGGIGSGKSVVSQLLQTMGYRVYDSDTEAKKLMNTADMLNRLAKTFGPEVVYGNEINRKVLASKVFTDNNALEMLNALVHPMVRTDFNSWTKTHSKQKIVFMESAILIESGFTDMVDEIWLVIAPTDLRVTRIVNRNNCTEQEAMQRIMAQSNETTKALYAHRVITNDNKTPIIPQIIAALS